MDKPQYHRTVIIDNRKVYLPQRVSWPAYNEVGEEIQYSATIIFSSWEEVVEFQEALLPTK